jgi:uncharacterized membrane protein
MIRVIALTQFVFVTLGSVAAIILVRAETVATTELGQLRMFLASHGLWLILIPIVWIILAETITRLIRKESIARMVQASGVLLAAAIVAVYGWVILTS